MSAKFLKLRNVFETIWVKAMQGMAEDAIKNECSQKVYEQECDGVALSLSVGLDEGLCRVKYKLKVKTNFTEFEIEKVCPEGGKYDFNVFVEFKDECLNKLEVLFPVFPMNSNSSRETSPSNLFFREYHENFAMAKWFWEECQKIGCFDVSGLEGAIKKIDQHLDETTSCKLFLNYDIGFLLDIKARLDRAFEKGPVILKSVLDLARCMEEIEINGHLSDKELGPDDFEPEAYYARWLEETKGERFFAIVGDDLKVLSRLKGKWNVYESGKQKFKDALLYVKKYLEVVAECFRRIFWWSHIEIGEIYEDKRKTYMFCGQENFAYMNSFLSANEDVRDFFKETLSDIDDVLLRKMRDVFMDKRTGEMAKEIRWDDLGNPEGRKRIGEHMAALFNVEFVQKCGDFEDQLYNYVVKDFVITAADVRKSGTTGVMNFVHRFEDEFRLLMNENARYAIWQHDDPMKREIHFTLIKLSNKNT